MISRLLRKVWMLPCTKSFLVSTCYLFELNTDWSGVNSDEYLLVLGMDVISNFVRAVEQWSRIWGLEKSKKLEVAVLKKVKLWRWLELASRSFSSEAGMDMVEFWVYRFESCSVRYDLGIVGCVFEVIDFKFADNFNVEPQRT